MEINWNMLTKQCQRHNTAAEESNKDNANAAATNMNKKNNQIT